MQQIIQFILEIDKLKAVTRKNKPLGLERYENSAEHSWQLALLAMSLREFAPAGVDMNQVIRMLLLHDIGEIDTGDTMVYVEGGWAERKAEELTAARRIFGILPAAIAEEYVALWQEFEAGETDASRFANAIDRAMPALLNMHNNGQSWRENGISYERVVKRIRGQIEDGCPALWAYIEPLLIEAKADGWFGMGQG
ncbi:MAG: HD domain-containing protein [Acidobacteria bacterium]|nr:HD domain-containing protein [Acidobacteriota bacterium]